MERRSAPRRCRERLLAAGDRSFACGGAAYLAEIAEAVGRHDEVAGFLAAAEELGEPEDIQTQSRVLGLRATVLARQGRHEEALSAADAAEAPLAATESPGVLAQTLLERATALRLAGRVADADAAVRRALDLYERKGNEPGAGRVRALLGAPVA